MHCAACGSEELTPSFSYATFESHFTVRNADRGMFGTKDLLAKPDEARVCLACGHVLTFVSAVTLEKIRTRPT